MERWEQLYKLGSAIHEKGNSHNPEYWSAANIIEEAGKRLKEGETDPVDEVKTATEKALVHEGDRVKEPANNTIVAVLTGAADGIRCNGCGEIKQMDQDGYCWSCTELYDRKPQRV